MGQKDTQLEKGLIGRARGMKLALLVGVWSRRRRRKMTTKMALREPSDNYSKGMGSRESVLSDREAWQLTSEYQKQRKSEN